MPVIEVNSSLTPLKVKMSLSRLCKRLSDSGRDALTIPTTPDTSFAASSRDDRRTTISRKVALGAGHFWGTERFINDVFYARFPGSIKNTKVGFMSAYESGVAESPTYELVEEGKSGHVHVVLIEFNDPSTHLFEELIRFFFQFHDPTTKFRQGSDKGFQFSSWVFCEDDLQKSIAQKIRREIEILLHDGRIWGYQGEKIITNISMLHEFTVASDEHQNYLLKHPNTDKTVSQYIRIINWEKRMESVSSLSTETSATLEESHTIRTKSSSQEEYRRSMRKRRRVRYIRQCLRRS